MKKIIGICLLFSLVGPQLTAQSWLLSQEERDSIASFGKKNHQAMLQKLGIAALRPGASGDPSAPNSANYDESVANPCPILPEPLVTESGKKVKNAQTWWAERRPEIVADFETEVYGKVPENTPKVTWQVRRVDREFVYRTPVVAKELEGWVDNSSFPEIEVTIKAMLVVPSNIEKPVPVLMMFGRPSFPAPAQPSTAELEKINSAFKAMMIAQDSSLKKIFDAHPAYNPITRLDPPGFWPPPNEELSSTEKLLAAGWGYLTIDPQSIQADNAAGLTRGIIGLTNKGKQRNPDDWGALRAWSWGAARALDYLETDVDVDASRVGIEGVSRYGKAALVTLAFEKRFAIGLIGSSGKGGATLHRRVFGEAVENLTGAGESHWMAGNYLKYGASEAEFGGKTACDLPVDSHQLIALCAPRPIFISYGIPEQGDSKWLDQKGSYMAAVAAGPVYKLLGAQDLGVSDDYLNEKMPPYNTSMLDGALAWRQHNGGHTDAPNMAFFITWANKMLGF